mmetsp:Transcript_28412/g.53309  ORF Transcript_28412/g.53309 Transcript_28412/m.53309 type:complete len:293 (-) Transcript_28412:124-1002(-)
MIGKDHGTNLRDGDDYGQYAVYISSEGTEFPCKDALLKTEVSHVVPKATAAGTTGEWELALNLNPSDGHDFGWGGPWGDDVALGSTGEALDKDFKDQAVMKKPAKYVAIARHTDKKCDAVRVWELADASKSMLDHFKALNPGRETASKGGPIFEYKKPGMAGSTTDPIFATKGKLMLNWWYANNGARIALEEGSHYEGLLTKVSGKEDNDDDVHGLGNEFGADTRNGRGSSSWRHDAAQMMTNDCHGGNCKMIGKDHGTNLRDGDEYGQYAVYISATGTEFPCKDAFVSPEM